MARERPIRDSTPVSDGGNRTETNAIERRSYLKAIAATAAAGGALVSTDRVAADSHDQDVVEIDYDEYYDSSSRYNGLADVYRVWNQRSSSDPNITSSVSRSGETSCAHHLSGDQMSANTVYPLEDHYGAEVDELYQRFYVHPNGMVLSENNTMRFFWLGLRNGAESSGAGWSAPHTGTDGWSVRAGFTRRLNHDHPNTYTFFIYSYDMRLNNGTTPGLEYGAEVQVPMDEWVKVESYQKLNSYDSSGANRDGVLRVWVNDELAYENTGLAWRSTDGQGIEEAGPHGYDLYQDNDPHSIYFDDHVLLVNGDRDDWQAYEGGSSSGGDGDEETDAGYENELGILTEEGADRVDYRFVADGSVETADLGTSPSGNPVAANNNDTVTDLGDGRYEVEGLTGNGWGDGFAVDGEVVEFEAANADSDADPAFWLEWNGEEVSVAELVGDDSSDDGSDSTDDGSDSTDDGSDSTDDGSDSTDDGSDSTNDESDSSGGDDSDGTEDQSDWESFFDKWFSQGHVNVYSR